MCDDRVPAALAETLRRLRDVPEGLIERRRGQIGQIAVARDGADVFMAFCPRDAPFGNEALSAVMARYDPADPLTLKGLYMQAMMACFALAPAPRTACVLGAGGGRLALVLRHLMDVPEVTGAELDPEVLALSRLYFGLGSGPGLRIEAAAARPYLDSRADGALDHLYVDCFTAEGRVPPSLATSEFARACAGKLSAGGALAMNLPAADPLAGPLTEALLEAFTQVWRWQSGGSQVLFGVHRPAARPELEAGAQALAARVGFGFDLAAHVAVLHPLPAAGRRTAPAIRDAEVFDPGQAALFFPPETFRDIPRNAPCPCGSGRKFKSCHGRA